MLQGTQTSLQAAPMQTQESGELLLGDDEIAVDVVGAHPLYLPLRVHRVASPRMSLALRKDRFERLHR
eukprot:4238817-Pleurochrysis_carterae.AAC.1